MNKTIKGSKRGLTFSFPSRGRLSIGCQYDYIIDKENKSIRITPSEQGRYKLSRKKAGEAWNALVDLRNKEVLAAIADMPQLCLSFSGDSVIVSDAAQKRKRSAVLRFPRATLASVRMAAGITDSVAVDCLLGYEQISFDEYLASVSKPTPIETLHKDLSDIYTMVSLFSGAGILDWPFAQDPRIDIRYAIDYDRAACETYRRNIGTHIVHGDIHRAFTDNGYPLDETITEAPDIIIGGPSCKPFSNANRHTRLADHKDSDLILQYMRIVKKLRPRVFAMENVPTVLTACGGDYFKAMKDIAAECGYQLDAKIVQDCTVGGYTTRKRAIILGSRIGPVSFRHVELSAGFKTAGDALGKIDESWSNRSDVTLPNKDTRQRMAFVPQGGNYTSIPEEYQTESKNRHSCTYRRIALEAPAPTIANWRKPPIIHPTEDRTLSVAEAKALHGLPGYFRICGGLSEMQQQVGNSVPVAIGRYIKNTLLSLLDTERKRSCFAFP